MSKLFTRRVENFSCENCGELVIGDGYTNHCPNCFFSKHVDNNPGDRESSCLGLMTPVLVETDTKKGFIITFRCKKCKQVKRNKISKNDNFDNLINIIKN